MLNKVIEIKLSEYAPIKDNICKTSGDHDQLSDIKFLNISSCVKDMEIQ